MLTHRGPTTFLIPIVSSPVSATHSSIASGMPTGLVPAFSSDLKNTEESSIAGPPGGTFDFVGKMPPSAIVHRGVRAVPARRGLVHGSARVRRVEGLLARVRAFSGGSRRLRGGRLSDRRRSARNSGIGRSRRLGGDARRFARFARAPRLPARRCAPKTTRRAGAACAALDATSRSTRTPWRVGEWGRRSVADGKHEICASCPR